MLKIFQSEIILHAICNITQQMVKILSPLLLTSSTYTIHNNNKIP